MRPVTDRFDMSREKLAYLIDAIVQRRSVSSHRFHRGQHP